MYRIVEWHRRYEVNSRGGPAESAEDKLRAGALQFVRLTVFGYNQGVGYRRLKQRAKDRTMEVFGIFCKLLEMAGAHKADRRGTIWNEKGDPATIADIAFILDIPEAQVKNAMAVLCDIGWLEEIPPCTPPVQLNSTSSTSTSTTQPEFPENTGIPEIPGNSVKNGEVIPYQEIVQHLNKILKAHNEKKKGFQVTDRVRSWIKARWNEGYRQDDFEYVHIVKAREWLGNPKMEVHVCPETLYSNKFAKYRNQLMPEDISGVSDVTRHNIAVGRQFLAEGERVDAVTTEIS